MLDIPSIVGWIVISISFILFLWEILPNFVFAVYFFIQSLQLPDDVEESEEILNSDIEESDDKLEDDISTTSDHDTSEASTTIYDNIQDTNDESEFTLIHRNETPSDKTNLTPQVNNILRMSSMDDFIAGNVSLRPMNKQTALITGGVGSLGSNVCREMMGLGVRYLFIWDNNEALIKSSIESMSIWKRENDLSMVHVHENFTTIDTSLSSLSYYPAPPYTINVYFSNVDISNENEVTHGLDIISTITGVVSPHIVVHSAGVVTGKTACSAIPTESRRLFETNANAPLNLIKITNLRLHNVYRDLKCFDFSQYIHVVISSASSLSYSVKLSDYSASKAAATSMLRSLRLECKRAIIDPVFNSQMFSDIDETDESELISYKKYKLDKHFVSSEGYHWKPNSTNPLMSSFFGSTISPVVENDDNLENEEHQFNHRIFPVVSQLSITNVLPWHIDTPMFDNVVNNKIVKFFFPSLKSDDVGRIIGDIVLETGMRAQMSKTTLSYHSEMVVPRMLKYLCALLNILPTSLNDTIVTFVGGWSGMDQHKGRNN